MDEPIVGWNVTVVDGDRRAGGFTIIYPLTPIEGQITRVEWTVAPMVRVAP